MGMKEEWRLESEAVAHANPWFEVRESQLRLPDGQPVRYFSVHHPRPAVGILALERGRALLIRQYRVLIGREVWAIPAGGVDAGETAEAAAGRELLEETGYAAAALRPFLSYFPTCGSSDQRFEIFLASGMSRRQRQFDRNEVMEVRWFGAEQLSGMLERGEMVDGLSLTPLLLAMRKGLL
jgi:ADP-ribose pyrophosphatase